VAARIDWDAVVGYADRVSARPGERVTFMVSAASQPDARVVSLPSITEADIPITSLGPVDSRDVVRGAHVRVPHHPSLRPADGLTVSTWVWLAPGAASGRRRVLISTWGGGDGWALGIGPDDRPFAEVGGGGAAALVACERPLERGVWTHLEAELDPRMQTLALRHSRRASQRTHPVEDAEATCVLAGPGPRPGDVLLGAEQRDPAGEPAAHLDGKLDTPVVRSGPGGEAIVAAWALGEGRGRRVIDTGPQDLEGACVNGPLRAVTGHNWRGEVHDWRLVPDQYGAMHFHADAVDDLGWPASFAVDLPTTLPGGVYALEVEAGGAVDRIGFAVRRGRGEEPAAHALLLPTFTYLAYSCEVDAPRRAGSERPEDRWVAARGLRSLYDRYDDGGGVYEASLRRPLTQLRPDYRCPQHGGPHGLAQDLILVDWLRRRGVAIEVLTDHDLHAEGSAALDDARVLITGAHPEYASGSVLDVIDAHLQRGGSLAYLGGNGLNGSISVDRARPHVIELRRTETQGFVWQAGAGEHHHASGEHGGDWRRRGRPEHRTLGVGLAGFGPGPATAYERTPTGDPAAPVVFEGMEPHVRIGADGAVVGGAAGYEIDSCDPKLGSPADTVVLASAPAPEGFHRWPDDVVYDPGEGPPIRADMVLVRRREGGAVFSVGSIAWSGCLAGDDENPVSRVTENALRELAAERPFAG
jgi:N,N-dimethylformamidase beta subunit-like, C-terminal/Concanavalin A-like lectin/glucanases superfamily